MSTSRTIPFEDIPKGARVILYGAGKIGRGCVLQNNILEWCNIVAVIDKNAANIQDFPQEVFAIDCIRNLQYDYVFVAVSSKAQQSKIVEALLDYDVSLEKIVCNTDCYWSNLNYDNVICDYDDMETNITICFTPIGAMGDHIVSLKLYQQIVSESEYITVDLFTNDNTFAEAIYYGQSRLRNIIHHYPYKEEYEKYDVVIECNLEPFLLKYNVNKVKRLSPNLARRLDILYEYQKKDLVDVMTYRSLVCLDRARFMGWNRYTLYGCSGAFDISDQYVDMYLNDSYESEFRKLSLPDKYITINCEADDPLKTGKRQTKQWPIEYYDKLVEIIKVHFPDLQVVQLGTKNSERILGVDKAIFGEKLEIVEYILKNALLHFGCEGGLVHMATQFETKCVVVFGPTPVWFFGYSRNENIAPNICGECEGLVKDWYNRCIKYDRPECVYSILPEQVYEKIAAIIVGSCEHGIKGTDVI